MSASIEIQGVEIPVSESGDPRDFVTPNWERVIDFYGTYCEKVLELGAEPYDPQPYVIMVCQRLEKSGARAGRYDFDWLRRLLQHFGLPWVVEATGRMKEAKAAAVQAKAGGEGGA